MYAYNASNDDPNEVSFAKGDLLEVIEDTGKWFQVRTPTGQTGVSSIHASPPQLTQLPDRSFQLSHIALICAPILFRTECMVARRSR